MSAALTESQVTQFGEDGFLFLRGFYDVAAEIEPIQRAIHGILALVAERHGLPARSPAFDPAAFDSLFPALIAAGRAYGGEVYDAIKQIPAFVRLVASPRHEALFRALRRTEAAGVAAGGFGIRIDIPREERFRADWHQEYPAQLRSLDGVVFWAPLADVTDESGPVRICVGSHRDGPVPVHAGDLAHPEKAGAYGLVLKGRDALVARYPQVAPTARPGDLLLMDFLTLHASGQNRSPRPRWTMQSRWFNFRDPTGMRIGWKGSYAAGEDFGKLHPELLAKP